MIVNGYLGGVSPSAPPLNAVVDFYLAARQLMLDTLQARVLPLPEAPATRACAIICLVVSQPLLPKLIPIVVIRCPSP